MPNHYFSIVMSRHVADLSHQHIQQVVASSPPSVLGLMVVKLPYRYKRAIVLVHHREISVPRIYIQCYYPRGRLYHAGKCDADTQLITLVKVPPLKMHGIRVRPVQIPVVFVEIFLRDEYLDKHPLVIVATGVDAQLHGGKLKPEV